TTHRWSQTFQKQSIIVNHKGILSLQDSVRPDVACMTSEKIKTLGRELLMHSSYSSDINPSGYHLFLSLDDCFKNQQFRNKEAVEAALDQFFTSKDHNFYENVTYNRSLSVRVIILTN
ncbi:Histone-lysine N-methyltransferase SETMAR, partial [Habropoda laboriosa]